MKRKALTLLLSIVTASTLVSCNLPVLPKYILGEKAVEDGKTKDEEIAEEELIEETSAKENVSENNDEISENGNAELSNEPIEILTREEIEALSDDSKEELGWDGEWVGDGVDVTISGADSGNPSVDFNDEEMHNASLDEAYINGNTITGVYRITWEMYAEVDNVENLPEQEWNITLVKVNGTIYYSRVAVLTWYNENEDGTFGHQVEKENSAVLTKVNVTEN